MARNLKLGLDYFPLDVDFFENEKIEAISGEFGLKGELTVIKLFCAIYKNGYYLKWNDLQKMKLLKRLPGINVTLLQHILERLVKWEVFNEEIFTQHSVLTSENIQKQFLDATKRRKEKSISKYALINVDINNSLSNINVNINTPSSDIYVNKSTQSKVKESKVKNSSNEELKKNKQKKNFENSNFEEIPNTTSPKNFEEEKEKSSAKKEKELEGLKNFLIENGADGADVSEWFKKRIEEKKPTTRYYVEKFTLECKKNNISVKDAVYYCAFNGWINFNPQWILNQQKSNSKTSKNGIKESKSDDIIVGRVNVTKTESYLESRRRQREMESSGNFETNL